MARKRLGNRPADGSMGQHQSRAKVPVRRARSFVVVAASVTFELAGGPGGRGTRGSRVRQPAFLHTCHANSSTQGGMVDRLTGRTLRVRVGGTYYMRTRTAAASAALILCTVMGSAACSSPSDGNPPSGTSTSDEQGKSQRQAADGGAPDVDPSACATSSDKIPEGCEADIDVADMGEATPAAEPPATNAWVPPTE